MSNPDSYSYTAPTEAGKPTIAYFCLIDFTPSWDGLTCEWHDRLLETLEAGLFTVWKDPYPEGCPQLSDGWFRVHVDAEVPEDEARGAVFELVRQEIIRRREKMRSRAEVFARLEELALKEREKQQEKEQDNGEENEEENEEANEEESEPMESEAVRKLDDSVVVL